VQKILALVQHFRMNIETDTHVAPPILLATNRTLVFECVKWYSIKVG